MSVIGHQAGAVERRLVVEPRDEGVDRRAGAEAVVAVVVVGAIGMPAALRGIASSGRSSRLPVGVDASGRVKKSFGHGCRQTAGSSGSQPACGSD